MNKPPRDPLWANLNRWRGFLNSIFRSDGSLIRRTRTRHVPPSAGHDATATPGTWIDPLGWWSFADATSILYIPIPLEEQERLRSVSARVIVPTGGTDQIVMEIYRVNCTDAIEDSIGQASSDTMVELQTLSVIGLAEIASIAPTTYMARFSNAGYQSGGTIMALSYMVDSPP